MPEETNKTNSSKEKNSEPISEPKGEATPVKDPAGPTLPTPELQLAAELTEPAISKEANPITQDLLASEVAETAKKAPATKPNKTAGTEHCSVPAQCSVPAVKEMPAPKTEQILSVLDKAEVPEKSEAKLPQDTEAEQAPKPTPPAEQSEQQLETPIPAAPQVNHPVQPPSRGASVRLAIPFMAKFKNKLAEFRLIANQKRAEKVQKNLDIIMRYTKEKQKITNDEVEKLVGVKDDRAAEYLNILIKKGQLVKFGKTSNIFYKPIGK